MKSEVQPCQPTVEPLVTALFFVFFPLPSPNNSSSPNMLQKISDVRDAQVPPSCLFPPPGWR